ncbi:MAG: EAL domain-containing protein [Actinomycetota bacterium]|nr:EAL domain-containing protein [Actinomycetota bacterium]
MPPLDLDLVPDLRRCVDARALQLHYQPEIDLASGAVVGMEALVRWQHRERGLLWPAEFLPVAAVSGLLETIEAWVLEQAVREVGYWVSPASSRQIWVNISASRLTGRGFVQTVADLVRKHALAPGVLGLEITEEALAGGGREIVSLLRDLRGAGVALAVDDVGTWYSSMASLGDLPIDAVKLDRRFVRGLGGEFDHDSIVGSVIELAHARGLYVVAEGVESWTEGARLCELGCDRAHGYLFSAPQRAEKARVMLAHGSGWRLRTP